MKKLFAIVLSLALLCAIIPAGTVFVSAATSGFTGDCYWVKNGVTVTISGNGSMADYPSFSETPLPWETATRVIIEEGVTRIGNYAFHACPVMQLQIADTVKEIGKYAFYGCSYLSEINLPDSVESVGECAFDATGWYESCSSGMVYVGKVAYTYYGSMPETLTFKNDTVGIADYAFTNKIYSVKTVILPDSLVHIGNFAFGDAWESAIKNVQGGKNVKYIGNSAFKFCYILESFDFSNCLEYVGDNAFYETKIKSVTIPKTCKYIGYGSFYECKELTTLTINDAPVEIGSFAFYGCEKLDDVSFGKHLKNIDLYAFSYCQNIKELEIPEGITDLKSEVFAYCIRLEKLYLPKTLTTVHEEVFPYCISLNDIYYNGCIQRFMDIEVRNSKGSNGNQQWYDAIKHYNQNDKYIRFPDVRKTDWYYKAIDFASSNGYFGGYSNGTFGPANNIARQDFVVILARIDGVDLSGYNKKSSLKDVKMGDYYSAAVNWAVENKIVTGYNDGRFGVGDSMTREQLVTMLYRYAQFKKYNVDADSTKAKAYGDYRKVSDFAKDSIAWAIDKGVINGMDAAHIGPQGNASRAQVAQILMNISANEILPL